MPDGGLYRPKRTRCLRRRSCRQYQRETNTTRSSIRASVSWSTWPTAVPKAPTTRRATVRAFSCRYPTNSSCSTAFLRPEKGRYGVGMVMLPREGEEMRRFMRLITEAVEEQGLTPDGFAQRPRGQQHPRRRRRSHGTPLPADLHHRMRRPAAPRGAAHVVRKRIEFSSKSSTSATAGAATSPASRPARSSTGHALLAPAAPLLHRPAEPLLFECHRAGPLARFSTNTFPTWSLAQPFRLMGHNGEINTIRGNRLWMGTREAVADPHLAGDVKEASTRPSSLDERQRLVRQRPRILRARRHVALPHVLAMLIPLKASTKRTPSRNGSRVSSRIPLDLHGAVGRPAAILFSDRRYAGGMLDRNGLRPARYLITRDGLMVIASETGVLQIPLPRSNRRGGSDQGKILMVDTEQGQILTDAEIKRQLAEEHPYDEWLHGEPHRPGAASNQRPQRYAPRRGLSAPAARLRYDHARRSTTSSYRGPASAGPVDLDGLRHAAGHPLADSQRFFDFFRGQQNSHR